MKLLCVLLPHFPLRCEVLRGKARDGMPTIVLQPKDRSSSQKIVLDFSPELERLQPDMPLQQALSLYGDSDLLQADVPYYRSVFSDILDRLEEKSPLVEGAELGLAYVGLDGLQLIYRSDDALIEAVKGVIPKTFNAQTGIAEGKFLAHLVAKYADKDKAMPARDIDAFLKDLPFDVLPVSAGGKAKLKDYGIRTLGQIRSLAAGPLQAQFGPEGKRILELARGYDDTPLYPRSLQESIEERTTLPSVTVSLDAILTTTENLVSRVFSRDDMKGKGFRSLTLWTRTWDGKNWERSLQFKEPALDVKSAMPRLRLVLESYPQPGPVEQMGIKIARISYGDGRQKSLFAEIRAQDHLMEDIKQLDLRLGNHQVFKVKEVEPWSRIPERRYTLTPLS